MDTMMNKLVVFLILISFVVPSKVIAGKKVCLPYLAKLRNIQAQQRAGYSNKKGHLLAKKEQKSRDRWWQCEQGKLPKKKKNIKKKSIEKKLQVKKIKIPDNQNNAMNKPFTSNLVIRAKFHGQQQQNWLDYYQKPEKCRKVKSTKMFAFCIEDKNRQQQLFELSP